ncbi:MAG: hypothetical protein AAF492_15145, partial [Verrucomicrobiota bacterium]
PVAPFRTDNWPFIRALPNWASDLEERKRDNAATEEQHKQWRRDRKIKEAVKALKDLGVEFSIEPSTD